MSWLPYKGLIVSSTHRERRAKYLQGLEAEVAHLRSKDAKNIMELKKTRTINKRLKALLDANNIPLPSDLEAIDPATSTTTIRVHGAAGGPQKLQPPASQAQMAPGIAVDLTDPQVAIEFILALEEPCLIDYHNHIGEDGETGHAMLLQSSVLQYAPTTVPTALGQQFPTGSCWNVPRAQLEEQLDSLLNTSMRLNLKGEMTPVMCWNKLRERHKLRPITRAQFQQLQKDLVLAVFCYG